MKISTIAVHGGLTDTSHYAAAFPVYLTSTFIQKGPTEFREYGYSRTANPTRSDVEKHAADIEGAKHGIATATGMAAVSLVFETLNAGDRVLISNNVYGGTWLYATELFKKRGVQFTVVDDFNTYDFETAPADVKLVYIETPSNPLLEVTDIAHVAKAAKARSWLLAVDNTFLTGVNQRPLDLGADVVIYSATKYYGGHSDLLAGSSSSMTTSSTKSSSSTRRPWAASSIRSTASCSSAASKRCRCAWPATKKIPMRLRATFPLIPGLKPSFIRVLNPIRVMPSTAASPKARAACSLSASMKRPMTLKSL